MNNYVVPKPKLILNWCILLICILFLTLGISSNNKSFRYKFLGVKTEARVLRIITSDDENIAKIRYQCESKLYEGIIVNVGDSLSPGDYITIYYIKDNPTDFIYLSNNGFLSISIVVISLSLFIIYLIKIIKLYRFLYKIKKTIEYKNTRKMEITYIEISEKDETFGTTPYRITCNFEGKDYISQLIYDNTKDPLSLVGYTVTVYYYQNFYFFDPTSYER